MSLYNYPGPIIKQFEHGISFRLCGTACLMHPSYLARIAPLRTETIFPLSIMHFSIHAAAEVDYIERKELSFRKVEFDSSNSRRLSLSLL